MDKQQLKELIKEDIKIALYSLNEETGEQLSEEEIRDFLKIVIREGVWDNVRAFGRGALAGTGLDYIYNLGRDTLTGQGLVRSFRGETERQQRMQDRREAARELNPTAYGLGEIGGTAGSLIVPMGAAGLAARGAGAAVRGIGRALPGAAGRATRAVGQGAVDIGRSSLGTGALTRSTISRRLPGNTRAQRIARGTLGVVEPSPTSAALGAAATGATAVGGERVRSGIENTVNQAYDTMIDTAFDRVPAAAGAIYGTGRSAVRSARRAAEGAASYLGMSYEPEGEMLPESVDFSDQELAYIASIMNEAMPVAPTDSGDSPNPTPRKRAEGSRSKGSLAD